MDHSSWLKFTLKQHRFKTLGRISFIWYSPLDFQKSNPIVSLSFNEVTTGTIAGLLILG